MTYARSRTQRWFYDVLRVVVRQASVPLVRIRVFGRHHLPESGGALLCANHQSHLDPVLIGLTCDRRLNFLARKSLFRFGPFGWLIRFMDAIAIDREGLGLEGVKETMRRLRRGELVVIFPEGTRTRDGRVAPLKPGLIAIARRTEVPLIPIGLDGAFRAWPRTRLLPRPAPVAVHIGPPLAAHEFQRLSDQQLLAELERRIRACHAEARATLER